MNISLRPAALQERAFLEHVFFTTQRWIIEELFGWRGDDFERQRFRDGHDFDRAQIILANGQKAGWLIEVRRQHYFEIDSIYILPGFQRRGIGRYLIAKAISEAEGLPIRLSVAKINPARSLYERLGFKVVGESEFKVFMERQGDLT